MSFTVCVGAVCQIWQLKFPLQVFLSLQSAFGVSVRRRGVLLSPEGTVPSLRGPEMTSDRELGNSGKNVEPWVPEGSAFWVQLCFWLTDLGRINTLRL